MICVCVFSFSLEASQRCALSLSSGESRTSALAPDDLKEQSSKIVRGLRMQNPTLRKVDLEIILQGYLRSLHELAAQKKQLMSEQTGQHWAVSFSADDTSLKFVSGEKYVLFSEIPMQGFELVHKQTPYGDAYVHKDPRPYEDVKELESALAGELEKLRQSLQNQSNLLGSYAFALKTSAADGVHSFAGGIFHPGRQGGPSSRSTSRFLQRIQSFCARRGP